MRVVGCFLEHEGKFVILLRHPHKPDGNTWGLPAGKVEAGEADCAAMVRELQEETGYSAHEAKLELLGEYDFTAPNGTTNQFVTYRYRLDQPHDIVLEKGAHTTHQWVTADECYLLPNLIFGLDELLENVGFITPRRPFA